MSDYEAPSSMDFIENPASPNNLDELAHFMVGLQEQLGGRLQTASDAVISRLDGMTASLDQLEGTVSEMIAREKS